LLLEDNGRSGISLAMRQPVWVIHVPPALSCRRKGVRWGDENPRLSRSPHTVRTLCQFHVNSLIYRVWSSTGVSPRTYPLPSLYSWPGEPREVLWPQSAPLCGWYPNIRVQSASYCRRT